MAKKHRLKFTIDVSINFTTQVLVFIFASLTSIIIARTLGPSGKGVYSLVITIITLAATFVSMGINTSNIYFIGKKRFPINLIIANSFFYSFGLGLIISLLLIILAPFFAPFILKGVSFSYLYFALLLIPFLLIFENIYYILLGYRHMLTLASFTLIRSISYLILLIIFYYISKLTVFLIIIGYACALFVALSFGMYFFKQKKYLEKLALHKPAFIEALKFGTKQHLGTIFQFLNYRFDLLIIAVFLTPTEVGLYSMAVLIAETVWYVPKSLGFVLYPKIASSKTEEANKFTPLVCRNTVLITLIAIIILYNLASLLIPLLFTPRFVPSVLALRLLLPGVFFLSISKVLTSDLTGRGYPHYSSIASFISLIVTIILDFLLIPGFGIYGASLASSIAYTTHALIILFLFRKTTTIPITEVLIFKFEDVIIYQRMIQHLRRK